MNFLDLVKETDKELYQSMRIRYTTGDFDEKEKEKEKEKLELCLVNHREELQQIIENSGSVSHFKKLFALHFSLYRPLSDFIASQPVDFTFEFSNEFTIRFHPEKKCWSITCITGFEEEAILTFYIKNGKVRFPKEALIPMDKQNIFILWENGVKKDNIPLEFIFEHHPLCKSILTKIISFTQKVDHLLNTEIIEVEELVEEYRNCYVFRLKDHDLKLFVTDMDKKPIFVFYLTHDNEFQYPIELSYVEEFLSKSQLDQLLIQTKKMIKEKST